MGTRLVSVTVVAKLGRKQAEFKFDVQDIRFTVGKNNTRALNLIPYFVPLLIIEKLVEFAQENLVSCLSS